MHKPNRFKLQKVSIRQTVKDVKCTTEEDEDNLVDENCENRRKQRPRGVQVLEERPIPLEENRKNVANVSNNVANTANAIVSMENSPTKRRENIMKAIQLSEEKADLIGDFSIPYALPLDKKAKHSDLKTITPETLAKLIRGEYSDLIASYTIIDGRYPYEYEGGHIRDAINIYEKSALQEHFLDNQNQLAALKDSNATENAAEGESVSPGKKGEQKRHILIFHCEFSSERGPGLLRFLRNKDREYNTSRYPNLYHPEIYLLGGGYKAFFRQYKELCVPQSYRPMLTKQFMDQMVMYRSKTKSSTREGTKWSAGSGILRCERKLKRISAQIRLL